MKLIAYYLPQYHVTKENNDFWGEGYTEWTNVKKAKPVFRGHYQPRVPLDYDYYDLESGEKIVDQMKLAGQYGIDAFCFYHYWFGNGKQVLHKPVDNFLKLQNSPIEYCFCWANETWTRTWNGGAGNREILMDQKYGDADDWERHINYLIPFFQDKSYLKINGKPVFLVFDMQNIPTAMRDEMFACWDKHLKENGIEGLFLITMHIGHYGGLYSRYSSGEVDFEPVNTRRLSRESNTLYMDIKELLWKYQKVPVLRHFLHREISYCKTSDLILERHHRKNYFRSLFVGYDDTPRRGYRSTIYIGSTPQNYGHYLNKTIQKSIEERNELIFIYAWNEWGESGYLEPDMKYRYRYLEETKLQRSFYET